MKAAVWHGTKDVRVEEVELRKVGPDEVKVKVEWAGICGSDLHAYHHGMGVQVGGPHPLTGEQAPLTLGHEFAGTIAELGESATTFKVGDRVCIEPLIYCGECKYCREGHYNQCVNFGFIGLNANGGFAEYVVVKKHMLHKLPDQVTLEEGALIEPAAVAFQAVRSSKIKVGDNVAVFGAGPIGLLTILCAKAAGAAQIIAVDISAERLEKAKEVGATSVIHAAEADTVKEIMALTGDGVAVAYEAAGAQPTFTNAVASLKKGGECMVIAAFAKPVELDMTLMLVKETNVTASLAYRHIFPEVISLVEQGVLDVKKVITKKIKLDHIVEEGLELLVQDKSQAKILVQIQP